MRYRLPRVAYAGKFPACFESQEQYNQWIEAARSAKACMPYIMQACADCTPEFKQRMEACGRCENRHVEFKEDDDGFLSGYTSRMPEEMKERLNPMGWLR